MATIHLFTFVGGNDMPPRRSRHSSLLASSLAAVAGEPGADKIDWSLLKHLAAVEESEDDEPRAA